MTPALALAGLHVHRAGRPVVADLDLSVPEGAWLGVIGANGSGKTTLLRAIAGRLPIAGGQCALFGGEAAHARGARATAIGFAPPIEALPGVLRVGQLLDIAGEPLATQRQRNGALWDALALDRLLDVPVGDCSSGMRQRAAIALAFARPTRIVLLDEPFNWLDPVAAFDVRAVLAALVRDGLTLVTALHDLTTLCGFCDAGIVLTKGRISLRLDRAALRAGSTDAALFEAALVAALR